LLDAADMGLPPGALRRLSPDGLRERDFGTHAPSLAQLVAFLSQDIPRILILGIQPLCLLPGRLSPPVRSALHALGRQLPSFPSALLPSAGASDMLPPLHE
jgi:hydrogenase maturation protease